MKNVKEKQPTGLQLVKSSAPEQVKNYFQKVFELKQSGKEFPINLDEVWPLVYQRKDYAVKELLRNFVENDDYIIQLAENQFFRQKEEKHTPGRTVEDYMLSVPCLEYFIAKKVKPVFEVYRQVFHKTVEQQKQYLNYYEQPLKSNPKIMVVSGIKPVSPEEQHDLDLLTVIKLLLTVRARERRITVKREITQKCIMLAVDIYSYSERKRTINGINNLNTGGVL